MHPFDLQGLRVLNTRPCHQADGINIDIVKAQGCPVNCPGLDIIASSDSWFSLLPELDSISQAIFISPNAVRFSLEVFSEHQQPWPTHIKITAMGKGTAKALEGQQLKTDYIPEASDSEHLLRLDNLQQVHDQTILLFKGKGGRTLIAELLRSRGARLIELDVYQRRLPAINQEQLTMLWQKDEVDIILFTSEEAMHNIISLFGKEAFEWLQNKPWLVISNRLANAAAHFGIKQIKVCNFDSIIETLHEFNKGLIHGK